MYVNSHWGKVFMLIGGYMYGWKMYMTKKKITSVVNKESDAFVD